MVKKQLTFISTLTGYIFWGMDNTLGEVEIRGEKLEGGNKATYWPPSPNDMAFKDELVNFIQLSINGKILFYNTKIYFYCRFCRIVRAKAIYKFAARKWK